MRHFYRSHLIPADAVAAADKFFTTLGMQASTSTARARVFTGPLGAMRLTVKPEGGHYTFLDVATDQVGESRLDRNVKRFFVSLHRHEHPQHRVEASY